MINLNIIETVKNRLISVYNPIEIYLFGSYAWGKPTEESDLDLLVVIEKYVKDPYFTVVDGYKVLTDLDIDNDLFVITREEFEKISIDPRSFFSKIRKKGKKIYATA